MDSPSREVTKRDIDLAQEMFNLGCEAGMYRHDANLHWTDMTRDEILMRVQNDLPMVGLLMEIYECGRTVGKRRGNKKTKDT